MFLLNVSLIVLIFCPPIAFQHFLVNAVVSLDIIALHQSSINLLLIKLVITLAYWHLSFIRCTLAYNNTYFLLSQIVYLRPWRLKIILGSVSQSFFDGEAGWIKAF